MSSVILFSQHAVPIVTSGSESDSETDIITPAVTGGVVAVIFIITTAVVIVVLLRNRRGHNSPSPQKK